MNVIKITNNDDLNIAFQIRRSVFVEEQGIPSEDEYDAFDTLDSGCEHILVFHEGTPVGTARIRFIDGAGKLQRVCILEPYRKFGLGKVIINKLEEIAKEKGATQAVLDGQQHAEGFYQKLGYVSVSEVFMEDGIPHIKMVKTLQ